MKDNNENINPADTQEEESVADTKLQSEITEVIGVKFKSAGKVYYFDPVGLSFEKDSYVIVETARGIEFGTVYQENKFVSSAEIVPPLRPVIRKATDEDIAVYEENKKREQEAFTVCLEKIRQHNLDMKLIEAEYTFDANKLIFYFSAEGRIDFRELVKDLASVFRTRIELRQIGIRDEAKMIGGLGVCGRPFCCSSFLSDFGQVSIKMAKEQNISLNSAKISGTCGRLMCCLKFEHETYAEEIKKTPAVGSSVKTPDGKGTITEINPLMGTVKVQLLDKADDVLKEYHRDNVKVLKEEK